MRKLLFLLLCLGPANSNAEVFKCIEKNGKINYQARPCNIAAKEQKLTIESDPAKEAEAKAKLEAVQNEYDTRKAAQEKAAKELAKQQREAAALEFARRSAIAQQEQALAQQRQAEALERQNRYNNRPGFYWPYISPNTPITPHLPGAPGLPVITPHPPPSPPLNSRPNGNRLNPP